MYEERQNRDKVSRRIEMIGSRQAMQLGGRRLVVRKLGWDYLASQDFIHKHVGSFDQAQKIARRRSGIPICHVLDYHNLHRLGNEIGPRVYNNNHGSKAVNPQTGNNQYYTNNRYVIYQTKYKANGNPKSTTTITSNFYYDAPQTGPLHGLIHHFDGIKRD